MEGEVFHFTVPGRPVPAARMTQRGKFRSRQAQRYLAYKDKVGWIARQNRVKRMDGPVAVEVYVYLHRGRQGDADNYGKSLTDSLNGIAYRDDVQIKRLVVEKRECGPSEERAEVVIKAMPVAEVTKIKKEVENIWENTTKTFFDQLESIKVRLEKGVEDD